MNKLLQEQIEATEKRFKANPERKTAEGEQIDWRDVESPSRVVNRMVSLGITELADQIMADPDSAEATVRSVSTQQPISVLERIIEENDLVSSRFLHIGSAMADAVGRIHIRNRDRTLGYGTGFLISPHLMMTNNHVLETESDARDSLVEFDYFERRDGSQRPTEFSRMDPEQFFVTDKDLDFTIVAVTTKNATGLAESERPWVKLIEESGKALVGESVNIIQHPGGKLQQIAIKNNKVTNLAGHFLHYKADTLPGSSGSPVFNAQWELAALHHSGVPKRNRAGRILLRDGSVWDGSRANSDQIAWIANEGVRISSIIKFVQQYLETRPARESELFQEGLTSMPPIRNGEGDSLHAPVTATLHQSFPTENNWENLSDEALNSLGPEKIAEFSTRLEENSLEIGAESNHHRDALVAEGDSWFDYKVAGMDIIDFLRSRRHGYQIYNVAEAGDTLENMAWGTKFNRRWRRKDAPLNETLKAVEKHRPKAVLLSGGGNDIAGEELAAMLNHKSSHLTPIREEYVEQVLTQYSRKAYEHIIASIWSKRPEAHIVTHGYGYTIPDGRAVVRFLGLRFIGPWLRPALTAKGYTDRREREAIMARLVDAFNNMLRDLATTDTRIHYIDLRPLISRSDWENELHLKNSGFRKVADRFAEVIRSIP